MNILDNHVHTHFSIDGKDTMEEVIKAAINKGVKHLTFTDHLEYNRDKFSIDCKKYSEAINGYKRKYEKSIELLTGIEVGYQKHLQGKIENIINSNPFDFVLCSTHTVDGINVSDDKYFQGISKKEAYTKYFESIMETTKNFRNYDSYGHLDYIIRYGSFENKEIIYEDYRDVIEEVLKNIISSGRGIELNTSGFRYGLNAIHPNIDILRRYKELGGEIITVGSDSHQAKDVCKDFQNAYDMLNYFDFKYVCIFKKRVPQFISIKNERLTFIA